jgi:phytanoyl-CoA hydroxylase
MSFASLKPEYDRQGFVVARQLLPPAEFAELSCQLERYIREVVPGLSAKQAFYHDRARPETLKQMQHLGDCDAYFRDYARHPTWNALARDLLGEEVECLGPEWFDKPPGVEHPTPPHQDNYYFNLAPPKVCTIWLALDEVDDENGCLRYLPGSHLASIRPHATSGVLGFSQGITDFGPQDEAREVKVHLQPGDATVHHGNTIHRAEPNRSVARHRRAFAMVLRGASCRRDEAAFARYEASLEAQHATLGVAKLAGA